MNVIEVMSREPRAVRIGERLDAAARLLWEADCGFAPVVDAIGTLIGVLTDRDLCMACYTQGRPLGEIPATAVMAREVRSVRPDDTIATALAVMQQTQVHRLPVVDARNQLVGVLSTNDLVRAAQARPAAVDAQSVLRCLAAIGAPRRAAAATPAATARPAAAVVQPESPRAALAASEPAPPTAAPAGNGGKAKTRAKPKNRKA